MNTFIESDSLKKSAQVVLEELGAQGLITGETTISQSVLTEVYGEGGKINLIRTCLSDHGRLKLLMNTKKGECDLIDFAPSTIRQAVGNALETARISPPDPAECISDERENRDFSVGPQAAETERMLSSQEEFQATIKADFPKVSFDSFSITHELKDTVYANTAGVLLSERRGVYGYSGIMVAREGDKTTSFDFIDGNFSDFETPLMERYGTRRKF